MTSIKVWKANYCVQNKPCCNWRTSLWVWITILFIFEVWRVILNSQHQILLFANNWWVACYWWRYRYKFSWHSSSHMFMIFTVDCNFFWRCKSLAQPTRSDLAVSKIETKADSLFLSFSACVEVWYYIISRSPLKGGPIPLLVYRLCSFSERWSWQRSRVPIYPFQLDVSCNVEYVTHTF